MKKLVTLHIDNKLIYDAEKLGEDNFLVKELQKFIEDSDGAEFIVKKTYE